MYIINQTDVEVSYTLKGGPLTMILTCCDLDPGEVEEWETPRWAGSGPLNLVVEVVVAKKVKVAQGQAEDTVYIEGTTDDWSLRVVSPGG